MTDTNARAALAARQERIARALTERDECFARVRRMRIGLRACNPWGGPAGNEHIPFPGHRTVADVMAEAREEQVRRDIRRGLGR